MKSKRTKPAGRGTGKDKGKLKKPARIESDLPSEVTPLQAFQFLEDMRTLGSMRDEPTRLISIRVPENILRVLKTRATNEGKRYQSLMIELVRRGLRSS